MAAFQPSDDNTHDLGTSSATWKDLHIKNIISTGETRFNLTTPTNSDLTDGDYVVASGDHIVFSEFDVKLPAPATANAGRELIVVNKNIDLTTINVIPSAANQVYLAGNAVAEGGTQLSAKNSIRLISTGTFWYAIAG